MIRPPHRLGTVRRLLAAAAAALAVGGLATGAARAQTPLGPGGAPALAHDPAAGVHLAIWEAEGTVRTRRLGRDGGALAGPQDAGPGTLPDIAHDPETGGWLAVWWRGDDVLAQPLTPAGAPAGDARTLWSGRAVSFAPSVARDPATGRFAVAWGNADGSYSATTLARLVAGDGEPLGPPLEAGFGDGVTIAAQPGTGGFVLAEQNPGHGDPPGIGTRFSWFTRDLERTGGFDLGETRHDVRPLLAPGPGEESLLVATAWWSGASTGYRMSASYGGPRPENAFPVPAGCCRAVADNPTADGYVLAWDGPVAQHITRTGAGMGGPVPVGVGSVGAPAIAADAAGAAVLVWAVPGAGVHAAPLASPVLRLAAPAKVTGVRAEALDGQVGLTWDAVPGAHRYGVAYGQIGGPNGPPVPDVEGTQMIVPKLRNGRAHHFRIAAKNAAGTGPQSDEARATPRDADGDGTPAWRDNCPETANADQSDRDRDGLGDACERLPSATLEPVAGRRVLVRLADGLVLVDLPSAGGFVPLAGAASVPVGSRIDTTKGRIAMTAAGGGRSGSRAQRATLAAGLFAIRQKRRAGREQPADVVLASARGAERACRDPGLSPKGIVRSLTVEAASKGTFRVVAGAGTASGSRAEWSVADRCDGTAIEVKRGRVTTETARGRRVVVRAGRSYLIRAKLFRAKRRR